MAKPFDYSKWDHIEISDDEEDCHPNIEKESWFRMKHRSRVEREDREAADKKEIAEKMKKNAVRIREIRRALASLKESAAGDSDSDDDALDDRPTLEAELREIEADDGAMQKRLDDYEKNMKWNVDNICHVVDEKTFVTKSAGESGFDETSGYALSKEAAEKKKEEKVAQKTESSAKKPTSKPSPAATSKPASVPAAESSASHDTSPTASPASSENNAALDYHTFASTHADLLEEFMAVPTLDSSREFLIRHGNIMLQEHASSYLLLASLEDEMNGYREKMRRTAHQSQILSNISELSKTLRKHPGNVVNPFFIRMQEKEHHAAFLEGVEGFIKNIIKRAVVKRKEMDEEEERRKKAVSSSSGGRRTHLVQTAEGDETVEEVDLSSLAVEERLGPGGLDPVAVFESLPLSMQEAFESREVEKLKEAVAALDPEVAEKHMRECVAAGLWNEG